MSAAVASQPAASHDSPMLRRESTERLQATSSPRPYLPAASPADDQVQRSISSSSPRPPLTSRAHSPPNEVRASAQILPGSSPESSHKRKSPAGSQNMTSKPGSSTSTTTTHIPVIKKERPPSPGPTHALPTPRHRPRKLDLSNHVSAAQAAKPARPSAPLTAKDGGALSAMQELGLACLSPGLRLQAQDPTAQSDLQRSMDVREQQRQIIEARLNKGSAKDLSMDVKATQDTNSPSGTFSKAPATSRRKGPPPGLSIHAPSPAQFASEPRVVQSAPLHQSFTGLKPSAARVHPLSRQVLSTSHPHSHQQSRSTSGVQITHVPANQTNNRLPPIQDVFAAENFGSTARPADSLSRNHSGPGAFYALAPAIPSPAHSSHSGGPHAPLPSPGLIPPNSAGLHTHSYSHSQGPRPDLSSSRQPDREFRSADEAVRSLSGGREDLLPKIVHYGGHQPPTPPSPLPPGHPHSQTSSRPAYLSADIKPGTGRRRSREEYEGDFGDEGHRYVGGGRERHIDYEGDRVDVDGRRERERERERYRESFREAGWEGERTARSGVYADRRESPETARRKKEEFMGLCARAWDLLHS